MARLPQPGGDIGTWGSVLNDFLQVSHNDNGTLKSRAVNVKDFGATGDGTTDDTAAIMSAINSLGATGGTVLLPKGTYKITSLQLPVINQTCGILLVGEGVGATRLLSTTAAPMIIIGNGGALDAQHYAVMDMFLEGSSIATEGIRLNHTRFTQIHRVAFYNHTSISLYALPNVHNYFAQIESCRFRNAPVGVQFSGGGGIGANSNKVSNSHFLTTEVGVYVDAGDNNVIENNEFAANGIQEGVLVANDAWGTKVIYNNFDGVVHAITATGAGYGTLVHGNSSNAPIEVNGKANTYIDMLEGIITNTHGVVMGKKTFATKVPLTVQGNTNQSADLVNVTNSAGTVLAGFTAAGRLKFDATNTAPANTTTPTAWLDVVIAGVTYKLPLYR